MREQQPEKGAKGRVYLVGAGPGDAGLITVRGVECLSISDSVLYDNLANPSLLGHAPATAEKVFVGKEPSRQAMAQLEINELLAQLASEGKTVTRLKGGDPFVFGRGGEEAEYLVERGIPFEVVPGVSSAIAVPAYAGIPVTHRAISAGFTVVTGHYSGDAVEAAHNDDASETQVDWAGLAKAGNTLVLLMGVSKLPEIAPQLIAGGRSSETRVAVICSGTTSRQSTLVSTLGSVAEDAKHADLRPPAVIVVGEVVRLRERIAWAESRPLAGIRVAVTRPADQGVEMGRALRALGAEEVATPTIEIVPELLSAEMRSVFQQLSEGKYSFVLFTSANGVRLFCDRLLEAGFDARAIGGARICAIGARTAVALKRRSLRADVVAREVTQEGLAAALRDVAEGDRILIPRAAVSREVLDDELRQRGALVEVLPLYVARPDRAGIARLRDALSARTIDAVTFTSASTFEFFAETVGESELKDLFRSSAVFCIGPITGAEVHGHGIEIAAESPSATSDSIVAAIADHFSAMRGSGLLPQRTHQIPE